MAQPEVLVLHGAPGSGKTTLARAVSELLRVADRAHAAIDLDELSLVHPDQGRAFARTNLAAVWPSFAAVPGIKVLVAGVLADETERELLSAAVPGARFRVCELTAPVEVLRARVAARGGDAYWQRRGRDFVDLFTSRTDLERVRDFAVSTHDRAVADAAREVAERADWL